MSAIVNERGTKLRLQLQSEPAECGLACVTMICSRYRLGLSMADIRRCFGSSSKGETVSRLIGILRKLGIEGAALRIEPLYFLNAPGPWIVHWEFNHFVVVERASKGRIRILDPVRGEYLARIEEVAPSITGVVIECRAFNPDSFKSSGVKAGLVNGRGRSGFSKLIQGLYDYRGAFSQVAVIALVVEGLLLILPLHMKWLVDQSPGSLGSVGVYIVGAIFLFLSIVLSLAMAFQGFLLSWLSAAISTRWTVALLVKYMNLPPEFTLRRSVADVMSRFQSLRAIQSSITGGLVQAILDGLASIVTLLIMLYLAPYLALVVLFFAISYGVMRALALRRTLTVSAEQTGLYVRQQNIIMECVRGLASIKMAGRGGQRERLLRGVTIRVSQKDISLQRITSAFQAVASSMLQWQRICLLSLGVVLGSRSGTSLGTTLAFVILADQFLIRANMFVDRIAQFRGLGVHVDRVEEISNEPAEELRGRRPSDPIVSPSIRLINVGYRYSLADPWVIRGLDLSIDFGESVAIVAPSGVGKSTLVKIIVGLLRPTEGYIEVNGISVQDVGLDEYRRLISCVLQDDQLFTGSIRDNISFFDESVSSSDIELASRLAEIHGDVEAMPMRYETFVGDMGSALSGGQKQRILLARALCTRKPILVLDEATSHLDVDCERRLVRRIGDLGTTRIVIAHRPDSVAMCDRVVELRGASRDGGRDAG